MGLSGKKILKYSPDKPGGFTEEPKFWLLFNEGDLLEYYEQKIFARIQNNLAKEQNLDLGLCFPVLFDNFLSPQSQHTSKETREVQFNGVIQDVEFEILLFNASNLPKLKSNTYSMKEWTVKDCQGGKKQFKGIVDELRFIFCRKTRNLEVKMKYHTLLLHPKLGWVAGE